MKTVDLSKALDDVFAALASSYDRLVFSCLGLESRARAAGEEVG